MSNKFRVWDSKELFDVLSNLQQFRRAIEVIYSNANVERLSDMPHSMIPTELLYDISVTYEVMFNQLLKENLIKSGNLKPSGTIH